MTSSASSPAPSRRCRKEQQTLGRRCHQDPWGNSESAGEPSICDGERVESTEAQSKDRALGLLVWEALLEGRQGVS